MKTYFVINNIRLLASIGGDTSHEMFGLWYGYLDQYAIRIGNDEKYFTKELVVNKWYKVNFKISPKKLRISVNLLVNFQKLILKF